MTNQCFVNKHVKLCFDKKRQGGEIYEMLVTGFIYFVKVQIKPSPPVDRP